MIREQGGSVLAQDQATSTVWGMPGAVTNAGLAHKLLPLNAIGPEILRLVSRTQQRSPRASGNGGVAMLQTASVDYGYLRQLVFGLSQNVLDPSRDYLFETRLTKVLRNQGMTHLEQLVQHLKLKKNPVLERSVAEAMTINETSFFRDSRPFELLRTELLPKLIEARRKRAACASGARPAPPARKAYSTA